MVSITVLLLIFLSSEFMLFPLILKLCPTKVKKNFHNNLYILWKSRKIGWYLFVKQVNGLFTTTTGEITSVYSNIFDMKEIGSSHLPNKFDKKAKNLFQLTIYDRIIDRNMMVLLKGKVKDKIQNILRKSWVSKTLT